MERAAVVIPVYNRENLIKRCLDSVYAQTYRPLQVVVVDNNSTDGTLASVEGWIKSHNLRNDGDFEITLVAESKPGAAAARNAGLKLVTSDWTLFFDSDDTMHPELVSEAMARTAEADIVCWRVKIVALNALDSYRPYHKTRLLSRQVYNCILSTQSCMVRTEFVRGVGGWCDEAMVWNDWELGVRIMLAEPRMAWVDRCLVTVYQQAVSITGRAFSDRPGEWEKTIGIIQANLERGVESGRVAPRLARKTVAQLDYRRAILAAHYRREGHPELCERLMTETLQRSSLPGWRKLLLRAVCRYTAAGGRAAYYLWGL